MASLGPLIEASPSPWHGGSLTYRSWHTYTHTYMTYYASPRASTATVTVTVPGHGYPAVYGYGYPAVYGYGYPAVYGSDTVTRQCTVADQLTVTVTVPGGVPLSGTPTFYKSFLLFLSTIFLSSDNDSYREINALRRAKACTKKTNASTKRNNFGLVGKKLRSRFGYLYFN
jgi:hypothetical protein